MAANEIHVGDIGTVFLGTVMDGSSVVDVSGATTKQLFFKKPDDTVLTKTAAFTTDGSDGKIQYASIAADLDIAGWWNWQGKLILPGGTWRTDVHRFQVHVNLA